MKKETPSQGRRLGFPEGWGEAVWDLPIRMRQEMGVVSPAVPVFGSPAASVPV